MILLAEGPAPPVQANVVVVVNVNFRKGGISPGRVFKISSTDFYTFDSRNTIARCRRLKMRTSSPQIPT